jgi:hypothetical protein
MIVIVNLSDFFENKMSESIAAFAKLRSTYLKRNCCGFFPSGIHKLWVMLQLHLNEKKLIDPYKKGEIDTNDFLEEMSQIFYFVPESNSDEIAVAWNKMIALSVRGTKNIQTLLNDEYIEKIILISNTNPLHVDKTLSELQEKLPSVSWSKNVQSHDDCLQIANKVYLCVSYHVKAFKEETLVTNLLKNKNPRDVKFISKFTRDRELALKNGIPEENVLSEAESLYETNSTSKLKIN